MNNTTHYPPEHAEKIERAIAQLELDEAALKEAKALEMSGTVIRERTNTLAETIRDLNQLLEYKPQELNNFSNIF